MLLGGTRRNPLVWLDDDFTTANAAVYTYQSGEHAVERPAEELAGNGGRLQTITIGPVSQGDADAILALCRERELDKLGLYRSAWADEEEETA